MSRAISATYRTSLGKGDSFATNTSSIIGGEHSVIVDGAAGKIVNSGSLDTMADDQAGNSCRVTTTCASYRGR
jgi:hypothetical protein